MKLNKIITGLALLSSIGLMSQAQAAGTLAGTSISNTANLQFSIGGVAQSPKASNTVAFVVDNKVNLIIVADNGGGPTIVAPGATQQVFKYKLTNLGNRVQDYFLSSSARPNGQTVFGRADNFDTSVCSTYADSSANNGTYEAATDTATYVDELAPDASKSIFVLCDIPATRVNGDFAAMIAQAVTLNGGTAGDQGGTTQQTSGPNTAGIDVVFADAANASFDLERDGVSSTLGGFLVRSAQLTLTKIAVPTCDPISFSGNPIGPKAIPGGAIRYRITISNAATAGSSAILGTVTDTIDLTSQTFSPFLVSQSTTSCSNSESPGKSIRVICAGGTRACSSGLYGTSAVDADAFSFVSPTVSVNLGALLPVETGYTAGELKAGENVTIEFNTIIK